MPDSARRLPLVWKPRRIAAVAFLLLTACYVLVFIADGAPATFGIFRDGIANALAAGIAAVPVVLFCRHVPWRYGDHWWFLPLHSVGLLAFNLLWYVVIAYTLASAALLSGAAWMPVFLSGPALHWQAMTGAVLYVAIAASSYTLQATREAQAAAALLHQAEVHALRAQLDPHLLFNTLHSLLELVRSGDTRADDAIDRFARVARYVSDGRRPDRDVVTLASEWQMTQDYVALERLRLGDRLHCRFDLGDDLTDVNIPALSLQPLVENAIRHGIAPRPGAGQVIIAARRHVDQVTLTVLDDGLGVDAATHGSGTGLDLVRRRLHGCFGTTLHFAAGPRTDGDGWLVSATFPANRTD